MRRKETPHASAGRGGHLITRKPRPHPLCPGEGGDEWAVLFFASTHEKNVMRNRATQTKTLYDLYSRSAWRTSFSLFYSMKKSGRI